MEENTYSSIRTFLKGRFRTLPDTSSPPLAHATASPLLGEPAISREEFMEQARLPETVAAFLCRMDTKLDAILAALHAEKLEQDFPHPLEVLEISAQQLLLRSPLPLAQGDCLEVVLQLGQADFVTASGIGSINAMRRAASGTVFDFRFTRLPEEEREKIIRFVFQEERKALREKRLG